MSKACAVGPIATARMVFCAATAFLSAMTPSSFNSNTPTRASCGEYYGMKSVAARVPAARWLPTRRRMSHRRSRRHSMTSAARASMVGGISRPIALAVLRLTTKSYFGRRLHRQVCRLFSLEDPIDVSSRTSDLHGKISGVGNQAAARDELALSINRRQLKPSRELNNELAMNQCICTRNDDEPDVVGVRKGGNVALDFGGVTDTDRTDFYSERWSSSLDDSKLPYPGGNA